MDVARLNMSHGTHEEHYERYLNVRRAGDETGRAVGVMADLQGPKIRLGKFAEPVVLEKGAQFVITTDDVPGTAKRSSTTHKGLPGDVSIGDEVLIDDGKVIVNVVDVTGNEVTTVVQVPGTVSSHKGLNLPGVPVSVPAMSEKDEEDLRWALGIGVDLVALSFVRSPQDRDSVDAVMDDVGRHVPVIAKLEKPQAIENLEAIISRFEVVMVARGDLGVEMPLEVVPLVQKKAVQCARENARPVIVATQVLESMVSAPRPTRAEVSDAANAIIDGADALMLSGETSTGEYPVEAVKVMSSVIENTEREGLHRIAPIKGRPNSRSGAITRAAADIAESLDVKALVTFTTAGGSPRRMARLRPKTPMLAFTPSDAVRSRMALVWGVETFIVPGVSTTDEMVAQVEAMLLKIGRVKDGDLVIICAGSPPGVPGTTNSMRVHTIGEAEKARMLGH